MDKQLARLAELYLDEEKMMILIEFGISMRTARKTLNIGSISSDIKTYQQRAEETYGKKDS